jgi:uncharacterized membrane protein YfcA
LPHHPSAPKRKRKAAAIVFIIFMSFFGLGIGYFASGTIVTLIIGAVVGGFLGYFIGHNLDRMARKK